METWWSTLNLPLQVFYATGILAGVCLIFEVVMTLFGFHHHDALEATAGHSDGLGVLSVRTITGFFFGFGWSGVIAMKAGHGLIAAILIAVAVGAAFLVGIYLLMRALFSLRSDGTLNYENAIGQIATVYVTIPSDFRGGGQVEVLIQGRLQTINSLTRHPRPLAPQMRVKVIGLVDRGTLEVEPL